MEFANNVPIYNQLADDFKRRIASGQLAAGEKIATVRELAVVYGVNPNTMQKALANLEAEGLVFAERTSGRYVTRDTGVIENMRKSMLRQEVTQFSNRVVALGYTIENAIWILEEHIKD